MGQAIKPSLHPPLDQNQPARCGIAVHECVSEIVGEIPGLAVPFCKRLTLLSTNCLRISQGEFVLNEALFELGCTPERFNSLTTGGCTIAASGPKSGMIASALRASR